MFFARGRDTVAQKLQGQSCGRDLEQEDFLNNYPWVPHSFTLIHFPTY